MSKRAADGHAWREVEPDHIECRRCELHLLKVRRRTGGYTSFWIQGPVISRERVTPPCSPAALPRSRLEPVR